MPPIVARKSSLSTLGEQVTRRPSRDAQEQLDDVRAEATRDVVVLAVDVGRHHPAQGHEGRAGDTGTNQPRGKKIR
jgi:hypothetical protein